jgi:hypothetical protein
MRGFSLPDQDDACDQESRASEPRRADGMRRQPERAEMIQRHRSEHLAGNHQRKQRRRAEPAKRSGIARPKDNANSRLGTRSPAAQLLRTGARQQVVLSMIRKLQSGEYRLYSRKINPKTGKRRNLGTFKSRAAAEKHERAVQYFKRH